jgi:hypothetical protein
MAPHSWNYLQDGFNKMYRSMLKLFDRLTSIETEYGIEKCFDYRIKKEKKDGS